MSVVTRTFVTSLVHTLITEVTLSAIRKAFKTHLLLLLSFLRQLKTFKAWTKDQRPKVQKHRGLNTLGFTLSTTPAKCEKAGTMRVDFGVKIFVKKLLTTWSSMLSKPQISHGLVF